MFSENLKTLRNAMKISQKKLSEYLFVSQQTIGKWETDTATPNPEMLIKIATFFNVSIDYLIGNDTSKTAIDNIRTNLSSEEEKLLKLFNSLTEEDKVTATGYIEFLTQNIKYKKTNIPQTKDEDDFDNAIDSTYSVEKAGTKI